MGVGAAILGNVTIARGSRVGGGAVVVNDVPPNCTVVGIPGRVVVREGRRIDEIDLHHEDLPDPVIEMFRCMQRRIDRLEARLSADEDGAAERDVAVFPKEDGPGAGENAQAEGEACDIE